MVEGRGHRAGEPAAGFEVGFEVVVLGHAADCSSVGEQYDVLSGSNRSAKSSA
ncbi:hypothetical protein [Kribbella sp. NBC_00889]|uniref:hypothetical protein n=1 Tax=Kribbella sp. NBC_00889 TaxID=2975974 RepID=UPI003865660A|nr:hypothetical protein OG817_08195 [Kribbella sp. NBC_00889]